MSNETVNHDTEIKIYQFESKTQDIKNGSSDERTSLTRVFEEWQSAVHTNVNWKKVFAATKITNIVKMYRRNHV